MSDTSKEEIAPADEASIPPAAIYCISGLIYQVLRPGTGNERPGPDDVVQVVYGARTETGHPFDSSGDSDTPKTLSMREIIPGLAEALQLMTVGQRMRIWIPPNVASDNPREAKKGILNFDIALVGFTRMKEYPSLPIALTSPRKEE
jgi:FKBP-type peptidyl-prolyl cis-trans isomerase